MPLDLSRRAEEIQTLKLMTLSRNVLNIRTNAENVSNILLDAYRDLIAVSDREGRIFVHDYGQQQSPEISSFRLAGEDPQYL